VSDTAASGSLHGFRSLWRRDGLRRYALAIGAIGVAFLLQMLLAWHLRSPHLFYFPALLLIGALGVVIERARAERALEHRERHLRTILETNLDGFWIVDGHGRLLQVNGAACSMSGYGRDELLTMRVSDLEAAESAADVADHVRKIQERGWDRFESRHRRKDGRLIDVELGVQCSGAAGEMVVFLRDITEARRSRLALERSEERFRALIEKSTDMIMVFDASAVCSFWSPSAVEALGWTPDEVLDHSALELVHADDLARAASLLEKVISRPGVVMREVLRVRHRDGSCRQVEATARNLLHDAAVQGVVLNGRDVTNQRLLEEQFWQSQKLESVGRLAGGVAHDFNNLLTVILSGVEELGETGESVPPSSLEIVGEIGAAADRGRDLTRQLLAFARKQVVAPVTVDLGVVVRGSDKLLRRLLGEDVDLVSNLAPDLWPIRSDPGQAGQVLLNLAVNASDAMPGGGRLTLETSNVEVGEDGLAAHPGLQPGPYVRLRVIDTGTGMSPEVKSRIFEPFFTTKPVGRGTGLGLATVYGIVKQSGGFISVESEPGVGTTFSVFFPRNRGAVVEGPPRIASKASLGTETVLVVEDDPQVRAVTVRALSSAGYKLLVAADGREGIALARGESGPLQLLVTDVVMPGLGGRAVAEAVGRLRPGLRVLFVSGYAPDGIDRRGELPDGAELLEKPFTPAALQARVRTVLDGPPPPGR
jgi:two-component system cell cycle sensor histidine kinase/response regulator CckA